MKRKTIKCSQCNETFYNGRDYRKHWEKEHLEHAMKYAENTIKKGVIKCQIK